MEGDQQFNPLSPVDFNQRSKSEKIHIGAIIVVALIAVIVGYVQLSGAINAPIRAIFEGAGDDTVTADSSNSPLTLYQDTDRDGLLDSDEFSIYRTSPYLEDSDSDGIDDKTEVDAGTDPNCAGVDCGSTPIGDTSGAVPTVQTGVNTAQPVVTPDTLRQMLISQGVPADQVASLSDQELLAIYSQVSGGTGQTGSASVGTNITSIDQLKNLTGAQIRQLLIQQGAPEDVLSQISDEQLKQAFMEKLNASTGTAN